RLISGTVRAFVVPLRGDLVEAHPILAAAVAITIVAVLVAWAVRWRHLPRGPRIAIMAAAGTVICVAPAIRLFGITPDLQGTRYVYLAGAWWSIALGSALLDGWTRTSLRAVFAGLAIVLVAGAAVATRIHLQSWTAARVARDKVLLQLISLPP